MIYKNDFVNKSKGFNYWFNKKNLNIGQGRRNDLITLKMKDYTSEGKNDN